MFNTGDKYIHFTRFGGVNLGEVDSVVEVNSMDLEHGVTIVKFAIKTTKGLLLYLDGEDGQIYKVIKEHSPEEIKQMRELFDGLQRVKTKKLEYWQGLEL